MRGVDLSSYDTILINSSAGKDSQAMLDYVSKLAADQGVSERVVVVHCDLGRVEWDGTKDLAREQAEFYGHRFEVVERELGDLLTQVEQRHEANQVNHPDKPRAPWPSSAARWCTSDQKTSQVKKLITQLTDERYVKGGPKVRILNCLGIRAAESPARAKKQSFHVESANGKRHVDRWLPIFAWSDEQVWERIRQSGVRHHWAYDAGMPRLSCSFCVLASKSALVRAAQLRPELAQEYKAVEVRVGFKFRNDISMEEIIDEAEKASEVKIDGWVA